MSVEPDGTNHLIIRAPQGRCGDSPVNLVYVGLVWFGNQSIVTNGRDSGGPSES
jgi:hypothetical protein